MLMATIDPAASIELFAPAFFAPAGRYLLMANNIERGGRNLILPDLRYDKRRKTVHRTIVADTRGPLRLTLPVARPEMTVGDAKRALRWNDIRLSRHDQWWGIHWTTLESAYGRTPFFEFYADRFLPFFEEQAVERYPSIVDYDISAEAMICDILLLPPPEPVETTSVDRSLRLHSDEPESLPTLPPYYQVRAERFGYLPGLSVIDLIMNLGPEASLAIRQPIRH